MKDVAMLPRLPICVLLVACSATSVGAAEIELHRSEELNLISIEGEIKAGDAEKFKRLALQIKTGVVTLDSPGGALSPSLEIGRTIQIAGLSTYVSEKTVCTSSCALIWVAGANRLLSKSARVGFHASYRDNKGRLEEVGIANAMIGRYLTLLNLPERSVMFATAASPNEILWLKTDGTDRSAIEFKVFDLGEGEPSQPDSTSRAVAPPPVQTIPTSPSQAASTTPIPQWYYFASDDGSMFYVRGQDVASSRATSSTARFWVKTDNSKNKSVSYRSTMARYNLDCIAETYKTESFAVFDASGRSTENSLDFKIHPVVPETVFASVAEIICSDNLPIPDERDLP